MKVSIIHSHTPTAEVLAKAIVMRLHYDATTFSCIENALNSSMDYEAFVVYNNFGHKLSGIKGVAKIRQERPEALIIGVSYRPYLARQFLPAGADAFILRAGNEVDEMLRLLREHPKVKSLIAAQAGLAATGAPATTVAPAAPAKPLTQPRAASLLLMDKRNLDHADAETIRRAIEQLKSKRAC